MIVSAFIVKFVYNCSRCISFSMYMYFFTFFIPFLGDSGFYILRPPENLDSFEDYRGNKVVSVDDDDDSEGIVIGEKAAAKSEAQRKDESEREKKSEEEEEEEEEDAPASDNIDNWRLLYHTTEQTHYFNCPYQLGTGLLCTLKHLLFRYFPHPTYMKLYRKRGYS
jgi:hypothetical protein